MPVVEKRRITANINVAEPRDEQRMRDFIQFGNQDYVYLLNPNPEIIYFALAAGKKVIARIYDPFGDSGNIESFDNQFHDLHSAEETFNWFLHSEFAQFRDMQVYFIMGMNEPTANSTADIKKGVDWAVTFATNMVASYYRVNLGGWNISKSIRLVGGGQGEAHCTDVDNGVWDPLLEFAHVFSDFVIIDLHSYTVGRAWSQLVGPSFPFDKDGMNNPPKSLEWWIRFKGHYHPYWHFAREQALYVRMAEQDWLDVRFGYGECIWDNMADISDKVESMRTRFGRPRFHYDMRGILSLRRYYAYLAYMEHEEASYTDIMFGEDAFGDLKWIDDVVPINLDYIAPFAWNENSFWIAYDLSHPELSHLIELIKNQPTHVFITENTGEEPMPTYQEFPELGLSDWIQGTFTVQVSSLRFRAQPTVEGSIVDYISGQFTGSMYNIPNTADGYDWYAVRIAEGAGWVAKTKADGSEVYFFFHYIEDEPPAPPLPEPVSSDRLKRMVIEVVTLVLLILSLILGYFGINFTPQTIELDPTPTAEVVTEVP